MQALIRHRWLVPVDPGGTTTWARVLEHLGHTVHVDSVAGIVAVDSVLSRRRVAVRVQAADARTRRALERELAARLRAAGADMVPGDGARHGSSDVAITVTVDPLAVAARVESARHRPLASWRLARALTRALRSRGWSPVRQVYVPADPRELLPGGGGRHGMLDPGGDGVGTGGTIAGAAAASGPIVRVRVPAGWPAGALADALYAGLVAYFGGPREPVAATPPPVREAPPLPAGFPRPAPAEADPRDGVPVTGINAELGAGAGDSDPDPAAAVPEDLDEGAVEAPSPAAAAEDLDGGETVLPAGAQEDPGRGEEPLPALETARPPRRRMVSPPAMPAGLPREALPPGTREAFVFSPVSPSPAGPARREPGAVQQAPTARGTVAAVQGPARNPARQPMRVVPSFATGREPGSLQPFR